MTKTDPKLSLPPLEATQAPLALITGGNGFLGRQLCATLIERGWRVRSLHRSATPALTELGVEERLGDVCDLEQLSAAAEGIDALYHLAGRVTRSGEALGDMYTLHIKGTRNVIELVARLELKRALYLSTSGVVGVHERPLLATEESPYAWEHIRAWPYYESKAFAEQEVMRACERGVPFVIARPSLLVGPGDPTGGGHEDILSILSGEVRAALPGGLNFVDPRDVARFLPELMETGQRGVGYLLGGENLTVRSFVNQVSSLAGLKPPLLDIPEALMKRAEAPIKWISKQSAFGGLAPETVEMGRRFWYLDSSAAEALGFTARPAGETLIDALSDLKERGFY